MNILLLGSQGQLGWELQRCLAPLGECIALDFPRVDFGEPDSLRGLLRSLCPGIIVNAAAYTAVDRAEQEPELAFAVNAAAPGALAEEAALLRAVLIHYSTDYVFDGQKGSPYTETDAPHPLNVYGQSKWAGEQAVQNAGGASLILRTSWLYSLQRDSFVTKVLGWARKQQAMRVVTDQVANPTWARMLAELTAQLLAQGGKDLHDWCFERRGIYHAAGSGFTSRYEWGKAVLELDPRREEQVVREYLPALTADYPTPAARPLFSALDCQRLTHTFGLRLPDWLPALQLAMETR